MAKRRVALAPLLLLFPLATTRAAIPTTDAAGSSKVAEAPLPVVLWHGMGDSCCNPDSMGTVAEWLEEAMPGVYVHSIQIGESEDEDRNKGFFDVLNRQVDEVCTKLREEPQLAGGFNALGFSQGGLFLRAYVERCNDPPVHNLVTFGSPHMGVADAPNCNERSDSNCSLMRSLIRTGSYLSWIQNKVVQAQYFKNPKDIARYLDRSIFLPDVNNERGEGTRKEAYKENLKTLNKLVLVRFEDEQMIVPAESTWFGFYDESLQVVEMKEQPLYTEDWIGLRWLDERGRVDFVRQEGRHMNVSRELMDDTVIPKYLAPRESSSSSVDAADQHQQQVFGRLRR